MKNYKGQLKGFPEEVVNRMLDCQVEQGNKRNIKVFEEWAHNGKSLYGFTWSETIEGFSFWRSVIEGKNFDKFFDRYPKKSEYPKVMMVSNDKIGWYTRVVFAHKSCRYIAWNAKTIKDSERVTSTESWQYAKEAPKTVEITIKEIADKFGLEPEQVRIKKD